jgi:hypothetical protein
MPWRMTFEGRVHREADLTIGMAERIEEITGENWSAIAPLRSAKHAVALLTVMHCTATGEPEQAVAARVKTLTVNSFIENVEPEPDDMPTLYTDGNPPKADAT